MVILNLKRIFAHAISMVRCAKMELSSVHKFYIPQNIGHV